MEELDELEGIILAGMLLIAAYIVTRIRLIKVIYKGGDKKNLIFTFNCVPYAYVIYFHLNMCVGWSN